MSENKRLTSDDEEFCPNNICSDCEDRERFYRLREFEKIGSPKEFAELANVKAEGRLLPEGFFCTYSPADKTLVLYDWDGGVRLKYTSPTFPEAALKQIGEQIGGESK